LSKSPRNFRALQQQLQWATFLRAGADDQQRILDNVLSVKLVEELRSTLDQFQHFLWCNIESVAEDSALEIDYAQLNQRLLRTTEILHHVYCSSNQLGLVENIMVSVDRYLKGEEPRTLCNDVA
jgi:hypothetical protein